MEIKFPIFKIFEPLLAPSRYKGAFGGRGSGKSRFMSQYIIERHLTEPGRRTVCIREVQKTLNQSAKQLLVDVINRHGLERAGFRILHDRIETPGDGIIIFMGMQDSTAESIKSLEGFDCAWVEEAQTLSAYSLKLLRPTIRNEGSEIMFSWNPSQKTDPVDKLLRSEQTPTGAVVIKANWDDNPMFPSVLEQERQDDLNNSPDSYDHVWEGDYITVQEGAYYTKVLISARKEGRIGYVARDPIMAIHAFFDIGSTGANADATACWVVQFIGKEIRVLNYYEAQGQPLATHINWLRSNDYGSAKIYLPHDGVKHDFVHDISIEGGFKQAGFHTTVIKNQGKGAAMQRVEAVRRLFPSMFINDKPCEGGLLALGWYHPKIDKVRGIDLGPYHDWSSNSADAMGYMAIYAERIMKNQSSNNKIRPRRRRRASGWMSS